VEAGGCNIIFDSGTGIAELGHKMMNEEKKQQAHIFFSHLHWDNIQGFPFFNPLYKKGNHFRLYGEDKESFTFKQVIEKQMRPPFFPITMDMMHSDFKFISISSNETVDLGKGIKVKTFGVNHPGGCLAYRVDAEGAAAVYCTDTEPMKGQKREDFLKFIDGAQVLIFDTHFTDCEYFGACDVESKKGWGHSSWQEGTKIAQEGNIDYLILYHHKESRSDREQQEIEILAKQSFKNTVAAREKMIVEIRGEEFEEVSFNYPD
jgi:phosphoribosyl 1,2-cyclic phosphodiesterase